jgi:hypothetical protein
MLLKFTEESEIVSFIKFEFNKMMRITWPEPIIYIYYVNFYGKNAEPFLAKIVLEAKDEYFIESKFKITLLGEEE